MTADCPVEIARVDLLGPLRQSIFARVKLLLWSTIFTAQDVRLMCHVFMMLHVFPFWFAGNMFFVSLHIPAGAMHHKTFFTSSRTDCFSSL